MLLKPAYGRRYHSRQEVLHAWNSGADFQIYNGPYTSIRDLSTLISTVRNDLYWLEVKSTDIAIEIEWHPSGADPIKILFNGHIV